MPTIHTLKTINPYFERVWTGTKLAEIRKNDRDFQKQDLLQLQEFDPKRGYSGREIVARVIDIVQENTFEGLAPGYCLMSLKVLDQTYYGSVFKKPVSSIPTCPEETGCAGCPEKGLTDACDKCSPPPLKKEAKSPDFEQRRDGRFHLKKEAKPVSSEKKSAPATHTKRGPYKKRSKDVGKYGIPSQLFASDKALYQRLWNRCKKKGIQYEEALEMEKTMRKRPIRKPKDTSKQLREAIDSSNEWTIEEDAAIRECPNEDMALTHFLSKFSESERTAVEVSQRWQLLRGQADEAAEGAGA